MNLCLPGHGALLANTWDREVVRLPKSADRTPNNRQFSLTVTVLCFRRPEEEGIL